MNIRVHLVRSVDRAGPRHAHGVVVTCSSSATVRLIPTVASEEMRPSTRPERTAGEDVLRRAYELAGSLVPFLQEDTVETGLLGRTAEAFGAVGSTSC